MSEGIRYKPGDADNNALLRLALLDAWGNRCYLCNTPLDFADAQIDHIIPHTIDSVALEALLKNCLTDEARAQGFELHAPHNLAPVCNTCNGKKGATTYPGAGQVMIYLNLARQKQPIVEKRIESFKRANSVARAMLAISIADLSDVNSREALFELGPLVINRLRLVAPEILTTPSNYDYPGDPYGDEWDAVLVTLDESSRRAKVILEDVHGIDFDDAITASVRAVQSEIESHLQHLVERDMFDKGHGDAVVDGASARMLLKINSVSYESTDRLFEIRGDFETDGSVDVNVASVINDSATEWVQEYADATGSFSVTFWSDDESEPFGVAVGDPILD